MGYYCCCGAKLSAAIPEQCTCDQSDWYNAYKISPPCDGKYLIRMADSSDRYEYEDIYHTNPIRFDTPIYGEKVPIHWESGDWENSIYQWRYLTDLDDKSP